MENKQVGVIACSGEECLGGTLSRMATRKVMEYLRPGKVVTLCLPLYIAGGEEERAFARDYPVIAVDGCSKCCAKRSTAKFSNEVAGSVDVSKVLDEETALSKTVSARNIEDKHIHMAHKVAQEICTQVDALLSECE